MRWLLDTNVVFEMGRSRPDRSRFDGTDARNARHFAGTGVIVYDPWNSETHRTEPA